MLHVRTSFVTFVPFVIATIASRLPSLPQAAAVFVHRGSLPAKARTRDFSGFPGSRSRPRQVPQLRSISTSFKMTTAGEQSIGGGGGGGGADGNDRKTRRLRFVDIGANLLDPMYRGVYRGKERHPADLMEADGVLSRAWENGVERIVLTGGTLEESRSALRLAREVNSTIDPERRRTFSTVGVHPTRCDEFFVGEDGDGESERREEEHVRRLIEVCRDGMTDGTVVAVGELGLDYDRLEFCDVDVQRRGFLAQLAVAEETGLPLFLHNRNTGSDLLDLLTEHRSRFSSGVVHSFDDTAELADSFVKLGLYIGINGCSLKTENNLNVVKTIPLDRILLETDCPWCDIRATHAGYKFIKTKFATKKEKQFERGCCVKSRNEPCHIVQVAEVVAGARGISVEEVAKAAYANSFKFFGDFRRP